MTKDEEFVMQIRISRLQRLESRLFENAEDAMAKEWSKGAEIAEKEEEKRDAAEGFRGSINVAKRFIRRKALSKDALFLTQSSEDNNDDLVSHAPLTFEYVPTKKIMK